MAFVEPSSPTSKKSPRTSKKTASSPRSSTDFSAIQGTLDSLRAELNELKNSGDKEAVAALRAEIAELKQVKAQKTTEKNNEEPEPRYFF